MAYLHFADEMIIRFTYGINNWIKTGEESEEFQRLLDNLTLPTSLQHENWHSFTGEKSTAICIICRSILDVFIESRKKGMSADDIKSNVITLCTRMNIETERVCNGTVTLNLVSINYCHTVLYIL